MSQKSKLPKVHIHTTSHEQWSGQVLAIVANIQSMEKELRTYERLYNTTMKEIIRTTIMFRKGQLAQKLLEVPAKDRPQDIKNNQWCRDCLE